MFRNEVFIKDYKFIEINYQVLFLILSLLFGPGANCYTLILLPELIWDWGGASGYAPPPI